MAKRVVTLKLMRQADDDGAFDREFWKKVGPEGILKAAFKLVSDSYRFRSLREPRGRLRRDLVRVELRGR